MQTIAVIMAGGSGERFWPVSRRHHPKQLVRLTGKMTLLGDAVERIAPLVGLPRVLVATSDLLRHAMVDSLPELPPANVLAEPSKRNTAGCLAYAAAHTSRFGRPDEVVMAVLTADHAIGQAERFRRAVAEASSYAADNDALVAMGIRPTRAETGYGYLRVGATQKSTAAGDIHLAEAYREKPDAATAEIYLGDGRWMWNSGMFFWRLDHFLAALERFLPEHAQAVPALAAAMEKGDRETERQIFAALPSVSIDRGMMEKAPNVAVLAADFPWDDVGEWSALERLQVPDTSGNVVPPGSFLLESEGCLIYDGTTERTLTVAGLGLRDLVVVATDDALLLVPKQRAQEVRRLVEELNRQGRDELL